MRQTLPWESVPPPIYVSRPPKPRKKWVTVGGWILVVLLLLFGLMSKRSNLPLSVISDGLALLYTLTLLTKKDAVVTTRGLEIFYQMQITTQYDFFPWEQINSIASKQASKKRNTNSRTKDRRRSGGPSSCSARAAALSFLRRFLFGL